MLICAVCPNVISEYRIKRWPHVRTCSPECSKDWGRIDSRVRMKTRGSWYRYRVTEEQFQIMLDNQGGACAVCRISFSETASKMMIDHDHSCCPQKWGTCGNCVRGIVCNKCNVFVSRIEDGLMEPTLEYLKNHFLLKKYSFGV